MRTSPFAAQRKPSPGLGVHWGHPFAQGLREFWVFSEGAGYSMQGAARGTVLAAQGAALTWGGGAMGSSPKFPGSTSVYAQVASAPHLVAGDIPWTVVCGVRLDAKGGYRQAVVKGNTGNAAQIEYALGFETNADRFYFTVGDGTGSSQHTVNATSYGSPVLGKYAVLIGWHDPVANTISIQVDQTAPTSTATTVGIRAGTRNLVIGRGGDAALEAWNGLVDWLGIWERVFSASERPVLVTEPFSMILPQRHTRSVQAAGFQAAWARGANRLISGGVWTGG